MALHTSGKRTYELLFCGPSHTTTRFRSSWMRANKGSLVKKFAKYFAWGKPESNHLPEKTNVGKAWLPATHTTNRSDETNHMQWIFTNCIVQKHLKPEANIANLRTSPSLTQVANHPTVTSACESRMTITGNLSQCNNREFFPLMAALNSSQEKLLYERFRILSLLAYGFKSTLGAQFEL